MITEKNIREFINQAIHQLECIPTRDFSPGKFNQHLSKAFVAALGRHVRNFHDSENHQSYFQDYKNGKSVSGEWLFDVVVVKNKKIQIHDEIISYPSQIVTVVESELASSTKALFEDFPKLLVVDAENKIYINGIKATNKKEQYIVERMNVIKKILGERENNSNFYICFVDHPVFWKDFDPFIRCFKI